MAEKKQRNRKRLKTDGEIKTQINIIVRAAFAIRNVHQLSSDPDVQKKKMAEHQQMIADKIALIESSEHPSAKDIANTVRYNISRQRPDLIAAGARSYFEFELNWLVNNLNELEYIAP